MPTSETGNDLRPGTAGFSLVEIMVALLVMSLFAGVAKLMAPGPERNVRDAARTLAARMQAAHAQSSILNRRIALVVSPEGYSFQKLEESGWTPVSGRGALSFSPWPTGVEPDAVEKTAGLSRFSGAEFDPVTGAAPAQILLSGPGANWLVAVDAEGEIHADPAP